MVFLPIQNLQSTSEGIHNEGIPKENSIPANPSFSGFMLEALAYESTDTTLPAYYEVSCKQKYTYDEDSARMLDLIFDGIIYNPATVYTNAVYNNSSLFSILNQSIPKNKKNNFASEYNAKEAKEQAAIDSLHEAIAALEQ